MLKGDWQGAGKELAVHIDTGSGKRPDLRRNSFRNAFLTNPAGAVKLIRDAANINAAESGLR